MRTLRYLLAVVACAAYMASGDVLEKLRPEGFEEETPAFWRAYAKKDLRRRLGIRANPGLAKNVIIFLGDGMGLNSVTTGRIYKGQKEGRSGEEEELAWDLFPFTGISKTYTVDYQVPDSAGTASGIFSGSKTRFGVVGIEPIIPRYSCEPELLKNHSFTTMLDWSQDAGKDTGIVTTARITHASPAALYAKSADRNWEVDTDIPEDKRECDDIAKQLVYNKASSRANLLFGGGRRQFLMEADGGKRQDEDMLEQYKRSKEGDTFEILTNNKELREWDRESNFTLGLFGMSHMPYELDRDDGDEGTPSLSEMTQAAIERLSKNDNGFFLFVEGARIDHGHHSNDAHRALEEVVQLELAVRTALTHPDINLDETLIIVTADHSHSLTFNGYPERGNDIFGYVYDDVRKNTIVYPDGTQMAYSTLSYANGNGYAQHRTGDPEKPWKDIRDLDYNKLGYLQPAMMPGPENDETHGGEDVAIYGIGPMAHLLIGVHEENYLGHVMAYAACIGEYKDDCDKRRRRIKV